MSKLPNLVRPVGIAVGVAAIFGSAWWLLADSRISAETGGFLRDGKADFVVTHFTYALGPNAVDTDACPAGPTKNVAEIFALSDEGQRKAGEDDETYSKRVEAGGRAISNAKDGRNYCEFPEIAPHDPHTQMMLATNTPAEGINIDGKVSRSASDLRSGLADFTSPKGTKGVDNQFWRVVGCTHSYQNGGPSRGFDEGIYVGEWGILVALSGVDNLKNDSSVEVEITASADPLMLSPSREALEFATYARDPDPAFQAVTRGAIVNGVLTTDPVDMQFHSVVNSMYLLRHLNSAVIQAKLSSNGVLDGFMAGYTPIVSKYDNQFAYRNGKDAKGNPADPRRILGSANGAARVLGHTCQGIWQSLHRLADGHPDENGKFTSISTQYKFEARPAFIVDQKPADRKGAADE